MGKHYVPRRHLSRFEIPDEPGFVWMFDKKTGQFTKPAISRAAQEADFYDPDVETALAEVVELPSNNIIDKLLRREALDNAERSRLALYMLHMATRGPRQRKKSLEHVPDALASVISDARQQLNMLSQQDGVNVDLVRARLEELNAIEAKWAGTIPEFALELVRTPFWSEATAECVLNMHWHVVPATESTFFVTSDTPTHIFEGHGVGTPQSELTFTISRLFALIGEHKRSFGTTHHHNNRPAIVKEINRRIISHAERFVFSPFKADWIATVASKRELRLNTILWE